MEQLINFIIRPPRAEYNPDHDLLDEEFLFKGKWYQRKDIEIKNSRGDILKCSHYMPIVSPEGKNMPCVIYCHGNSGCRSDASEAAILLLPSNITVFALDFSGSGLSGGEHVTLGWHEKDDLKAVVDYLRAEGNVSLIGLWGRSMGAVTSLLYGAEDPSIAGMVLDSPFSDLVDLMMELVDTYKFPLPKFTVKFAIQFMRKSIQKKAKFDIMDLNTIKVAKSCFVPVLFGHAVDDDFIRPHHSDRVFEAYVGDKNIIKFEGDHNSPRPQFYFDSINIFFHNVLQPPEDEVGETFFDSLHNYFDKGWAMPKRPFLPNSSTSIEGTEEAVVNGTVNTIEQVRSRRPMSRMEVPSDTSSQPESKDDSTDADDGTSSSRMISFELSNGHPVGPHVPTTTEDDDYLEYEFDDFTGFPSNVEEEERMVMEAIIESLKDLEVSHPQAEDQMAAIDTPDAAGRKNSIDCIEDDASNIGQPVSSSSETSSDKEEKQAPSGEPVDVPATVASEHTCTSSPDSSIISNSCMSTLKSGSAGTSARSDAAASVQSSSDGDMSSSTKATLTVERSPSNHIMDGLMRRWDLNFFRNGRQKSSTGR